MHATRFSHTDSTLRHVVFSTIIALIVAVSLPAVPDFVPQVSSTTHAQAAYCGVWANSPYQGYGATGVGGASCGGAYYMDQQTCLRKQRSYQPDDDTSCSSITWGFLYNASNSAWQCDASNNYRTRSYTYYNSTGNLDNIGESPWTYLSASC